MNFITLRFNNSEFEHRYSSQRKSLQKQSQTVYRLFLIILISLEILGNIVQKLWFETILNLFALLIMLLGYIFKQQLASLNNTLTLIAILIYNIQHPIKYGFLKQSSDKEILQGYFICLGTLGIISQWSYLIKTFITIVVLILNITSICQDSDHWRQVLIFTFSSIIAIYSFYTNEQQTRISFIIMNNKDIIEENLYKQIEIQSYIVHFNLRQNQFDLIRQNRVSQITENKQQNFINLIRSMKVILFSQRRRKSIIQSSQMLNPTNKLNLEQFLFYLFMNHEKMQEITKNCTVDNQTYELIGLIGLDVHHIKIIRTEDTKPCLIILIKENRKESQNKSLKYKLKISNKLLNQVQESIQSRIRVCLIYLKQILSSEMLKNAQLMSDNKKIILFLNSQITKTYTDINNIQDFANLNSKFTKVVLNHFDLSNCIQECISIFNVLFPKTHEKKIKFISHLTDNRIYTDQKKLKQLLFNCLFFIFQSTEHITIELKDEESKDDLSQKFIKFDIIYSGSIFTAEKISKLPILNPQSLEELRHNSYQQLNLEIPIALMIIRQIGPYKQMQFKQNAVQKQNMLSFYVFKSLEDFHLIPIISLHPSDNLITNQKLFKKSSYVNRIEKQKYYPTEEPHLETFRQISEQMISKF
ncbi:unnamed protein product (macronuclear) [Paramecium tetraurelia]|uniref:Transmembrane protein n=1 Tax=Paramecium tetraurelia TaxID=5888 RepID=A0DYM4_PARTE|nr:uncharacterized protein GSPATT00003109001 [Paramecium tetraurelia]CAK88141.1 unnamed protein product [Paramecium tetraurelia]|eukprot:XP_001455538.1 hypothetical protein (macronuclear) [Paramecium tetraurelia strain d4-2]